VVEAEEVEGAVGGEEAEFIGEGDLARAGAAGGNGDGDDQRAELLDAVGVAKAGEVGVEGEDVGGFVVAEVPAVESVDGAGISEAEGDGAGGDVIFRAAGVGRGAAGLEGLADGVGEEVGDSVQSAAGAESGLVCVVDLDVDAVGGWGRHGGRIRVLRLGSSSGRAGVP